MPLDVDALLEQAGLAGLQEVPLDRIIPNPANPRRDFDAAELDALAASIVKRGLLQPISLFLVNGDGLHVIRFGERRFRAAALAGLATIKALISDRDVAEVQLVEQIVENDQRVDLSAAEMSDAIHALAATGMTKAAIAAELGRDPATISLYAAVRDMPPLLRDLSREVAIRPLHDLYRLWRRDPDRVADFVGVTAVEHITRRAVDDLVARRSIVHLTALDLPPAGTVPPAARPSPPAPAACGAAIAESGRVRVRVGQREGQLLFPPPLPLGIVLVRFDGGAEAVEVQISDLAIVAVAAA